MSRDKRRNRTQEIDGSIPINSKKSKSKRQKAVNRMRVSPAAAGPLQY